MEWVRAVANPIAQQPTERITIYLAGVNRRHLAELATGAGARHILISWRTAAGQFERLLPHLSGCRLLLDPGYGRGGRIEDYVAFAKRYEDLWDGCLAWDVPGGGALETVHWLIHSIALGLPKLVPVFHAGTPWRFLDGMQEEWGRVALGGLLLMPLPARIAYLDMLFYQPDGSLRTPTLRAHGLGQDHPLVLARYPWASADSSTWLNPVRFGKGGEATGEIRRLLAKGHTPWQPPGQGRLVVDRAEEIMGAGVRTLEW